ncbi:hypothetical protein HNR19_004126 [Nocardioides thalensis]|uniref:Gas vesicle protein n=1 Tax=Nocardioides thalensis TaxID=1914755 RepID=A0A853CAH2_9ACTN|nr:hypothetical protein [Nocardioides thalensis]
MNGTEAAKAAVRHLADLTGRETEAVVGLDKGDDGWRVVLETVELRRVPSTTDVLATYEVALDTDGELSGCRRVQRYSRGATREEE